MDIKQLYDLCRRQPGGIITDSRQCIPGSVFLALKGENFDGNRFALQALQQGCTYAIVEPPFSPPEGGKTSYPVYDLRTGHQDPCDQEAGRPASDGGAATSPLRGDRGGVLIVDDCLQTLKLLAREHRRQFNIPVIAITGTNGKTTTKELVRAVLQEKFNVLATEGNFNNDVGVPKTLLRLRPEHQIAIIEMGASHPGDIKTLAETAEPTCGLITNVGRAHLQGFGSFQGVVKTKGELYDYLRTRPDGLVFINADNDDLCDLIADDDPLWVVPYSTDPDKQYSCISGQLLPSPAEPDGHAAAEVFLRLRWRKPLMDLEEEGASQKWHKVQTQLVGAYNIDNVLAAIAVGINFGVDRKQICHALENYQPANSRSQLVQTAANSLIVDAYNANPTSMAAALENFGSIDARGLKKMLILGDMRELGPYSTEEHQKIVDFIGRMQVDDVWLVGDEFAQISCPYRKFASVDQVKTLLATRQPRGCLILIKGSNGTRLHQLPPLL